MARAKNRTKKAEPYQTYPAMVNWTPLRLYTRLSLGTLIIGITKVSGEERQFRFDPSSFWEDWEGTSVTVGFWQHLASCDFTSCRGLNPRSLRAIVRNEKKK